MSAESEPRDIVADKIIADGIIADTIAARSFIATDKNGEMAVQIGGLQDGRGYITIGTSSGKPGVSIFTNDLGGTIKVNDIREQELVKIAGLPAGGGFINVYNSRKKMVATLRPGPSNAGGGLIALYDHTGTKIGEFLSGDP